jgi:hypothetical protein
MEHAQPHTESRGPSLLIEHVEALNGRPPARERLERLIGPYLAGLLVGALAGGRPARHVEVD